MIFLATAVLISGIELCSLRQLTLIVSGMLSWPLPRYAVVSQPRGKRTSSREHRAAHPRYSHGRRFGLSTTITE